MATGVELATAYVTIMAEASQLAPQVNRELNKVERHAAATGKAAGRHIGDGVEDGGRRGLDKFAAHGDDAGHRAGSNAARSFATAAGRGIKQTAKAVFNPWVTAAATAAATGAATIGIKTASQLEQAEIAFTTMLGSAQAADAFIRDMKTFAANTPFEFVGLQNASSQLIAAGVETEKVIPIMRTLGDVTSGMGTGAEGISRATYAIQQMNAAQKISAEDLNQLRDAGIPVYDLLSASLGKTKAEVAELVQKGKLGKDALDAMMGALETGDGLEKFNGLMDAQSQSMAGLWSTLSDTFSMGMADAIQPLVPLIKDGLGLAIEFTAANIPKVAEGLKGVGNVLPQVSDFAGELAAAFRESAGAGDEVGSLDGLFRGVSTAASGLADVSLMVASGLGFVARHSDKLALAIPVVVAGFVALKTAQVANAALGRESAVGTLLQVGANVSLAASNRALAASIAANNGSVVVNTVATNANTAGKSRGTVATLASRAATIASTAATKAATAGQWLMNAAMTANPIGLVVAALAALGVGLVIAYRKSETFRRIVDGAFGGVAAAGLWLWDKSLKPVFSWIGDGADDVGATITWLWDKGFRPSFTFIGRKVMETWNKWLSPTFSWVMSGVDDVAKATRTAVDWMGRSWDSLKNKAAGPARWVIDRVINPLIKAYNSVAGVFDAPKINQVSFGGGGSRGRSTRGGLQAFAFGGLVPGWSPHDKADNVIARLTAGEFVLPVAATERLMAQIGPAGLEMLRMGQVPLWGDPVAAYAQGGIVQAQEWMRAQAGKPYLWGGVGPAGYDCSGFTSASINAVRGRNPHQRLYATGQTPSGFKPGPGLVTIGIDRPGEKRAIGHTAINVAGLRGESRGGGTGVLVGGRARDVRSFNHLYHMGPGGSGFWGKLKGLGASIFDVFDAPRKWVMGKVGNAINGLGGTPFGRMLAGMSRSIVDSMVDKLKGLGSFGFADGGMVPDVKPVKPTLYDEGGYLPPGLSLVQNNTGKPERVVAPHQENAGITLNVDKIVGVDADDIARELHRQIKRAETLAGVG